MSEEENISRLLTEAIEREDPEIVEALSIFLREKHGISPSKEVVRFLFEHGIDDIVEDPLLDVLDYEDVDIDLITFYLDQGVEVTEESLNTALRDYDVTKLLWDRGYFDIIRDEHIIAIVEYMNNPSLLKLFLSHFTGRLPEWGIIPKIDAFFEEGWQDFLNDRGEITITSENKEFAGDVLQVFAVLYLYGIRYPGFGRYLLPFFNLETFSLGEMCSAEILTIHLQEALIRVSS